MTTTISSTERLSETWLLERTYHAQLSNGRELSVPDFTQAMKQIMDFSVPLSTWQEISPEEAQATYRQGIPVLLYNEHAWEHPKGASGTWRPNKNMRIIIYGNARIPPEAASGTNYAVCYLDVQRGNYANSFWKMWFSLDPVTLFDGSNRSNITFFRPDIQFPFTTHYTIVASDGHVHEYADRAGAMQGFATLPSQEVSNGGNLKTTFPQFCYYHEVTCPDGIYHIEFFGPRMNEQGYKVREKAAA
jgi:hypothetical protein